MYTWLRTTFNFLIASFSGFCVASVLHTQTVLQELSELDIAIGISHRLATTLKDFTGLLPSYGIILTIGFLISFSVSYGLFKTLKWPLKWLYPVSGFVAIITIISLMYPILNVTLLASARSMTGVGLQALAGVVAGLVFYKLSTRYRISNDPIARRT